MKLGTDEIALRNACMLFTGWPFFLYLENLKSHLYFFGTLVTKLNNVTYLEKRITGEDYHKADFLA